MRYLFTKAFARLILGMTMLCGTSAMAQDILKYNLGTSGSSIPYENAVDDNRPGIFVEILPLIMNRAGIKTRKMMLSTKRAMRAFQAGELDFDFFSPGWLSEEQRNGDFVFSVPIAPITEYLIALPENIHKFQTLEQAYGGPVGTISGYVYFDDKLFTRVDFSSESNLVLALSKHRIQVAIMEEATARYWSARHNVKVHLGAIHTQGDIALRFHKRHADLIPAINAAVKALKAEGKINAILNKYADMKGVG